MQHMWTNPKNNLRGNKKNDFINRLTQVDTLSERFIYKNWHSNDFHLGWADLLYLFHLLQNIPLSFTTKNM